VSTPKESPDTLALRAPPRPVTRLNRRSLVIVVAVLATTVMGGTLWSLQSQRRTGRDAPVELHNTDRIAHADGLAQLPDDYSKLVPPVTVSTAPPVLGPPLPSDLGGALLQAGQPVTDASLSGAPMLRADPVADAARAERINRQREAEEAAKASLFFKAATRRESALSASAGPGKSTSESERSLVQAAAGSVSSNENPDRSKDEQQQKQTFMDRSSGTGTLNAHELQSPVSPYQVMAGTVIPASLITGINSDLPGQVLASVTENVYDTATGRHLLIPQGSRLIGQYDSQVAFGQRRVLLVWTRLMLPDASSIALDRLPGVDTSGYAGLQDGVDWHWQQLLASAALSTLIGVGAELAAPDRSNGQSQVIVATRQSVQDSVNQVGQELTRRSLNVQPTLAIRPGFPVRVIVNKDLVLRPYQPLFFERSKP
jgi:type IV secretion system protein VirB10